MDQRVIDVPGVVTAVLKNGFFMQDSEGDDLAETSEGLFVFTSAAPAVGAGDHVAVSGRVVEFYPGGKASGNLPTTQIAWAEVRVLSSGHTLPPAVILSASASLPRERSVPGQVIENDAGGGPVDVAGPLFDPEEDALDFFESLEGMRVRIPEAVVVGPRNRFGEIVVVLPGRRPQKERTPAGGLLLSRENANPERLMIDDAIIPEPPLANVGDRLESCVGGMDYSFGSFKILSTEPLRLERGPLEPRVTSLKGEPRKLTVASYNVFNLHPGDGNRLKRIARQIVENLKSPDIVALQEMQDNNGKLNDDVVAGDETFDALVDAIAALGGPRYAYRQVDPADDEDGGEPGGNIRVGYLYQPERADFSDRFDAPIFASVSKLKARPFTAAGRFHAEVFAGSRQPLVAACRFQGETIVMVNVHLTSRYGTPSLFGRLQPATDPSRRVREEQMKVLKSLVDRLLEAEPRGRVVVLGDCNDSEFSSPLKLLAGSLVNLTERLPREERYTYVYRGNSQALDHILVTEALAEGAQYEVVHVNAEFTGAASDHDPVVARFTFP